jgi:hypothetical protein
MPVKKEPKEMSAFERRRLENIAANQALLKDISVTASKIIPAKPNKPAPSSRKRKSDAPVKQETAMPTRRSSRVAGLDADSEVLKRKYEVAAQFEAEKAKAKRTRVSGDLDLGNIAVEGKKWEGGFQGLKGLGLVRGAQPGLRTFTEDDVKNTTDKDLKALRLRINGLKLYEHWSPNGMS